MPCRTPQQLDGSGDDTEAGAAAGSDDSMGPHQPARKRRQGDGQAAGAPWG